LFQMEHGFRDWKSHLGLRGLVLRVAQAERLLRLWMGFTLAYALVLWLGQDAEAEKLRACGERLRARPRHGTWRVLSVLSLALYWLWSPERQALAWPRLAEILHRVAAGQGVRLAATAPG